MGNKKYDYRKNRGKGTINAVLNDLEHIKVDELICEIYLKPENEFEKWLIKEIEKILVIAKIKPDEFEKDFVKNLKKISETIKVENKIQEFYNFVYKAYKSLYKKEVVENILYVYYNVIIELSTYLAPIGKIVCGVSKKTITTNEIYPDLDKFVWELNQQGEKAILNYQKFFKQKGYDVSSLEEVNEMFMNERIISNNLFIMAFLIDENYLEFIKEPFYSPNHSLIMINDYKTVPVEESLSYLENRCRFLSKDGIAITDLTDTNIEEIFLKEKFHLDRVFLLFRLKVDGEYTAGFYDTKDNFFYSVYEDVTQNIGKIVHKKLYSLILDFYTTLISTRKTNLIFSKEEKVESKLDIRNFEGKYGYEIRGINFQIRKLPSGYNASEESLNLAKKYGIKLAEGYTFVRPFTKKVRVKGEG